MSMGWVKIEDFLKYQPGKCIPKNVNAATKFERQKPYPDFSSAPRTYPLKTVSSRTGVKNTALKKPIVILGNAKLRINRSRMKDNPMNTNPITAPALTPFFHSRKER